MTVHSTALPLSDHKPSYNLVVRTARTWKISRALAAQVIARDMACIYCRLVFSAPFTSRATCPSWEHIVNDVHLITLDNVALCCGSCNSSKGKKSLREWLQSGYCVRLRITEQSIAAVAKAALASNLRPAPLSLG
jgi:hypothetical protein